jgi:lipopolysaccharide cholinephosphotransferase
MRRITDINELRNIQMGILDDVHRFCQEQGLTYSLSSGTLIGAVRHQGYIPWDDDIDIYMPRNDYEVFVKTYQSATGYHRVINPAAEPHYYYTFAKVVDQRTRMVEDEVEGYEIGVFIDVFPIDYVSDDAKERERIFRKKYLLYKIRRCKLSQSNPLRVNGALPLRSRVGYLCYKYWPMTVAQLNRKIRRLIVRDNPTHHLCNMTEAGPRKDAAFPADDFAATVEMLFEGKKYMVMEGYDEYLTQTYGDYMTLPPEDQRVTHHFEAYWL